MPPTPPPVFDVIVIGAGMAGLTAARRTAQAGRSTLLLEASERIGGRVWSVAGESTTIELGAEFVHGEPEPTLSLAREAGVALQRVVAPSLVKQGDRWQELRDPWQPFETVLSRLEPQDEDVTAKAFVAQQGLDPEIAERFRHLVEGFEAAPFDEVGIRSLAADSEGLAADDAQFRVPGGYQRLAMFLRERALAAGAEVRLNAAVRQVVWRLNGPVRVGFDEATAELEGRTCVIAVPLSALQSTASADPHLRVEPEIKGWRKPLERLAMGHACRYTFELPLDFARDAAPRNAFTHQPNRAFETAWSHETERSQIWTLWAGGPRAIELGKATAEERERRASSTLAALLTVSEDALRRALLAPPHAHDFSNDPWFRGAYSFCRPGGSQDSATLATPIGDALFMAGEATDHHYPGTVAGALASGARAAEQVLTALARRPGA